MADRPRPIGLPGLRARVVRGPRDGRWYWRAEQSDGTTVWSGWATPIEAARVVAQLVAEGRARPAADASNLRTLDELLRAYIAHIEDTRPDLAASSMKAYRLRVRQVRDAGGGTYLIERLNQATMEVLRGALLRRLAPRTARACFDLIAAAWMMARRDGATPDRDLVIPTIEVKDTPKRTPTPEEIEAVVEKITVPWAKLGVLLLWATGARIGEVAAAQRTQLDLGRGELRLEGKTGTRFVPLRPELVQELRAWLARADHLHPELLLGVTYNTARVNLPRRIEDACEELGQPRWTPHALRRAAVDVLARAGVEVATAAALMGHTPQVMFEYYRQVTADDLRGAIEAASLGTVPAKKKKGKVVRFGPGRGK